MLGKTEEDVQNIKEWFKTQHHLPEIMDDNKIRNMLRLSKFNVKKTKEKIDNYYTLRSKYPDLFHNPKLPHMKKVLEQTYISYHPLLLNGIHRVMFISPKEPNTFNPKEACILYFAIMETRLQTDTMADDIIVVDMSNLTFKDMLKVSLPLLLKLVNVYRGIFSLRIKALYFLNSNSYISLLVKMLQFVLPAKIYGRLKVYEDAEILKEIFAEDTLLKDYGGHGPSLEELNDMIKDKFKELGHRFDLLETMRVDESLRPK